MNWKDKKVLVTGGDGMIGRELVEQLKILGAKVNIMDIKRDELPPFIPKISHAHNDCRQYDDCIDRIQSFKPEFIFHLCGIKGNIWRNQHEPVDFMGNMLRFDTNMILAARECGVSNFLYTSSIAVENFETDMYPAWAKTTAEKLIEAVRIQYPADTQYCIVRPANVYGRFDDYKHPELRGMVVSSLISKAIKNDVLEVWGDGSDIRDFINARDVAHGMIKAMEEMPQIPVNLCSGQEVTIKELAETIAKETDKIIIWDESKPKAAPRRVMKCNWDFTPQVSLQEGIKECVQYAKQQ